MSKAVLFSIKPKYCELIASGKKTVEVRKTRPKIDVPFKGYIYCTLQGSNEFFKELQNQFGEYEALSKWNREDWGIRKGKIIGEFVCKAILPISITYSDPNSKIALREFPFTCLTDKEIMDYLGNGKTGYGFHISDLVIYDKPKELSEFRKPIDCHRGTRRDNCFGCWDCEITRPPQSWGYVEELP